MSFEESLIQQACVHWFALQYPKYQKILFAVPNGGKRSVKMVKGRSFCTGGKRQKDEGMVSGVADLILLISRGGYTSLCIEMKTSKGKQSDSQKEWQKVAEENSSKYVICRSVDDFMIEVQNYLSVGANLLKIN